MHATLENLGVATSFSRPRVSNDNAYAESLLRTCKYGADYQTKPFVSVDDAWGWMHKFVRWYNHDHKHSGPKFVMLAQRHSRQAVAMMAHREQVYWEAKCQNPRRWSQQTRNWKLEDEVWLKPARIQTRELQQPA